MKLARSPTMWTTVTLDDVAIWGSGGTPSRKNADYYVGTIPWIKTGELGPRYLSNSKEKISEEAIASSSAKIFPEGAIAIAMYGATIGKTSILACNAATNQACAVALPYPSIIHTVFLYYLLRSEKDAFIAKGKGGAQPNISQAIIKKHSIDLPPLAEQKQIAAKLDKLLAQVDTIKTRLDAIPVILKRFRQSVLAAAVSGRLTEEWRGLGAHGDKHVSLGDQEFKFPDAWSSASLSELIDAERSLCYGVVQPGPEVDGGVNLIRVCDIERGIIDWNNLRTISPDIDKQYQRSRVLKGDLLVTVVGTIGRIARVDRDSDANIARAIARVAPNQDRVRFEWIECWLTSPAMQWWLVNSAKEVARKTLNLKELRTALVALPSTVEQTEIVRRVEQLFAFADQIEQRVKDAQARVNHLTQSILAKAFRGELTAEWREQNPDLISGENSAQALLERIKAEREKTGSPRRTRSKRTTR